MFIKEFKVDINERAYQLALESIRLFQNISWQQTATSIIVKQLLRSITSIGANITEAQSAASKRDFQNFIRHAFKSSNESLYWLRLLVDCGMFDEKRLEILLDETRQINRILGKSLLTMKSN